MSGLNRATLAGYIETEVWKEGNPMPVVANFWLIRVSGEPGSHSLNAGYEITLTGVYHGDRKVALRDEERAEIFKEIEQYIDGKLP